MQQLITFMAVVGGLVFSIAVALLVEELIFGQVFKLLFKLQPRLQVAPAPVWAAELAKLRPRQQR